ncbi:asparagine synthase (glutamine-hydrolyzing) [Flagellimonas nanhaiensis]|uniref:asparagine synthase (glutamine-hydrolyzing) n=1 Tax=Flagellimonas nanhaiensis TaxID=2292706 RepID=A0A371JKV8_9FLAO|nr:asparagine synthase (glutamine-hydrolyzing) [Allomuricauda nanhaiensis]RDY57604.1 asparagine synthase (glutamine-hydrolyzing) [Allomuricauda nanhaiensis]
MCGIYFNSSAIGKKLTEKKLKSIQYRGPDHMGIENIDGMTFGHLRLSILDLDSRSNQPMEYYGFHIIFNGEIYNYLDVREKLRKKGYDFRTESDTEVLLASYKEWGNDMLQYINGMFAFVIYDTENKKLFAARDRLGVKPFYYYFKNGVLEICSQLKPILLDKKTAVNKTAISIFLDCRYVPSPYTIVEDVFKLPPGNFLEYNIDENKIKITEYWNLKKVEKKKISYEEAKSKLHDLLTDAVKIRLQSDVPIGSFLSGGIDSALVSSIAAKVSNNKINTFSIGFDDQNFNESDIAERYASIIGSNHKTTICQPKDALGQLDKFARVYDEPFADSSALPSLLLNKNAKEVVTVALSGDGGDESFLGYYHFPSLVKHKHIIDIPYFIRKVLAKPFFLNLIGQNNFRVKKALSSRSRNDFIENIFSAKGFLLKEKRQGWMKHYQGYKIWSRSILQKAADLNIKLWLENDSNVKVDRASMAYSVEVRSPFLDYRVVEFARSLPVSYRYMKGRQKRILRDILSEYIPEHVFNQPKRGFNIPLENWLRKDLRDEVLSSLNNEFLEKVPNLDSEKFKKLLDEHMNKGKNHTVSIWTVYVLSRWYKEFQFSIE